MLAHTEAAASLPQAIARAGEWLAAQARAGFPDTTHRMRFPHAVGFGAGPELQSADGFARSVLAGVLLDLADLGDTSADWRAIAAREAERLAAARLRTVRGGWSYFPALPELPPDIDSLGAAITLFARVAPQYLPLCREPLALALAGRAADGQLPTWIIAPADPPAAQARMQAAVRRFWGTAPDLDAQTRLQASLALAPALATDDVAQQGLAQLLHQAQPEGDWLPTWYPQREELSILALPLLRRSTAGRAALARAIAATAARRWDWPQEAAQALWLLLQPEASQAATEAAEAALAVLQEHQSFDGSWVESAWIRMPIGRAQGTVTQVATWGCRTLATAFGLRALRACAQR